MSQFRPPTSSVTQVFLHVQPVSAHNPCLPVQRIDHVRPEQEHIFVFGPRGAPPVTVTSAVTSPTSSGTSARTVAAVVPNVVWLCKTAGASTVKTKDAHKNVAETSHGRTPPGDGLCSVRESRAMREFRSAAELTERHTGRENTNVRQAGVTQLVECNLAKVDVAGSNPVSRSIP